MNEEEQKKLVNPLNSVNPAPSLNPAPVIPTPDPAASTPSPVISTPSHIPPQPPAPALETVRTYEKDLARALSQNQQGKQGGKRNEPQIAPPAPPVKPKNPNPEGDRFQQSRNAFLIRPQPNYPERPAVPPPTPPIARPEPKPEIKPEIKPLPRPEPPPPPPPPIPIPLPKEPQPVIRTYENDVASSLANKKTTVATMVIAENERNGVNEEEPKKSHTKQIVFAVLSLIFIGGGVFLGYYFYKRSPLAAPTIAVQPIVVKNIIPYDKQAKFSITGLAGDKLIAAVTSELNKTALDAGKISELILEETVTIPGAELPPTINRVTGSVFIRKINIGMPDALVRSLTDRWMIGTYGEGGGQSTPYIAFTTDFFQNAFAGMLSWEKTMPDDLAKLLNYEERARKLAEQQIVIEPVATTATTSSSTPPIITPIAPAISPYFGIQGQFIDKQIRNRDVREFVNARGQLLFLYSFTDKETFIITTTESAFAAIVDRIENQTYVR